MAKLSPKVTPENRIPVPKENNYFEKKSSLIHQIRFIVIIEMIFGINRLFLFKCGTFASRLSYLYCLFLCSLTVYGLLEPGIILKSFLVVKVTSCVTYMILIIASLLLYKSTLVSFFENLANFDDKLNITKYVHHTIEVHRGLIWMAAGITYSAVEFIILYFYVFDHMDTSLIMLYVTILAHDSEQIFYVTLIRAIMFRVRILKAHIAKIFKTENFMGNIEERPKIEALSDHADLDTTEMHRAYDLLHTCAEQLNSVMSFPMIVMLFSSGLSTTLFLKRFLQISQDPIEPANQAQLIYTVVRCLKYTVLVIIPCYYASLTSRQVASIRTMLHNAVNTFKLDKIERRKVKAFFQLTQDNEFAYALWGVIRLSMSLPLSYASLCTTYLVITIQFSKFID